ncbi:MAG: glycosyltransferase family 4 protein, partial [bacterium]
TCHQYKLVCPSYRLFIMHKNEICEKCVTGRFYNAAFERCHKNSLAASMLVAAEGYIHRLMKIYNLIDIFHVPSHFLGQKLQEGGFSPEKIWHSFYTINLQDYPFHPDAQDYFIYYGRLSEEKGILTLLKAMKQAPESKLRIAGDGPQRRDLEAFAKRESLQNVEFLGNKDHKALVPLIQNSKFVVVPSEWYDNSPLVIYESFSMGKPVIASTLGGMPELVDDGENGMHFHAKDVEALANKIRNLWRNPALCVKMGKNARKKAELEFSPETHYDRIMGLYERLLASKRRRVFAGSSSSSGIENLAPLR